MPKFESQFAPGDYVEYRGMICFVRLVSFGNRPNPIYLVEDKFSSMELAEHELNSLEKSENDLMTRHNLLELKQIRYQISDAETLELEGLRGQVERLRDKVANRQDSTES